MVIIDIHIGLAFQRFFWLQQAMPNGAKNWVFTTNNWTEDDLLNLEFIVNDPGSPCCFVIAAEEHAPSTGTPHLQGYVSCTKRVSRARISALIPRSRLAVARGTLLEQREYLSKEGGPVHEWGTAPAGGQGARTDLAALHASLQSGSSLTQIANEHFSSFLRYNRGILLWKNLNRPHERTVPEVVVRWGVAGTGKTRSVWEAHPPEDVYVYGGGGWFDGYHGQSVALFDDFHGSELPLNLLLKVLDRYPLSVPVKGSFTYWNPSFIYITSNLSPDSWFPNIDSARLAALRRRFTRVEHFNTL